ncbi:molecular chaperone DnaJ [uncultured Propionibacterium sp.]|uniref:molecular chaperone DnaJ n=1 Tax=uncultured Propionibacterium sp. TaxID=218066 RepID=UPI00292DA38E|nr:molecular chaperone DnaJ [uncultured Propionibacterium sp.]
MSTKDWLEKDYYKTLGVSKNAKPEQIKKAFRRIARENHPDQHPGDRRAEERFKEASEANEVLSDPAKRKEYDELRAGGGFRFNRAGGAGGTDVNDVLRNMTGGMGDGGLGDLFGGLFNGGTARRTGARRPRRGADVEGEVSITFLESVKGTTVGMQMVSDDACPVCRGTGAKAGTVPRVCPNCQGSGVQSGSAQGVFGLTEPCPTCSGRGMIVDDPCTSCHGSGRAKSQRTMQVRIPAGVTDGRRIRVKGKGGKGENGGDPGDLYVLVHVASHPLFGRSGDNLTVTAPITYAEAALGAEIEVPTLEGGDVRLRIPAGTPNGRTFRARGKGVGRPGGGRGDLLVTVEVQVPAHLSDAARSALRGYVEAASEPDPRAGMAARATKR